MKKEQSSSENSSIFWPSNGIGWLELLLKVILISASLSAVYQYFEVKQENRVKKTLEFVNSFNEGKISEAKLRVNSVWDARREDMEQLHQSRMTKENKSKIMQKLVFPVMKDNQHLSDIDLIVNFFDNLQICIKKDLCDESTAKAFLGDYAESFYNFYYVWIEKNRNSIVPKYADRLEVFVIGSK